MYYLMVLIFILVMLFLIVEVSYYNKFQLLKIKINESLNNIDILLEKKLNLLERCIAIIKDSDKKYKDEIILENLSKIKNKKLDRFELNKELMIALRDYYSIIDLDLKLASIEAIQNIGYNIVDVENDLNAAKNYYNDNIVSYNQLVKGFPSSIVGRVFHYTVENFFKEEKLETLEILKENQGN